VGKVSERKSKISKKERTKQVKRKEKNKSEGEGCGKKTSTKTRKKNVWNETFFAALGTEFSL